MENEKLIQMLVVRIPFNTYKKFKMKTIEENKTIKEVIIDMMENYIKENKDGRKEKSN